MLGQETFHATAEAMTDTAIQRVYVDCGYRGLDYQGQAGVMTASQKSGLTPTMTRELKRPGAIEPMIGHTKNYDHLDRNHLLGSDGEKIKALLAAAGLPEQPAPAQLYSSTRSYIVSSVGLPNFA